MGTIERIVKMLAAARGRSGAVLKEWAEKFEESPVYALTWADETFQAAGREGVFRIVQVALEEVRVRKGDAEEEAIEGVVREATYKVMNHARWPPRSTSATSSLVEVYTAAAWAEVLDIVDEARKGLR